MEHASQNIVWIGALILVFVFLVRHSIGFLMNQSQMITDDEYFQFTGQILNNLSVADMALCNVFRVATNLELEMAPTIFFSFDSFHQRRNLLLRTTQKSKTFPKELLEKLESLLAELKKSNDKRNEYAHHPPFQGDDGKMYRVSPKSLQHTVLHRKNIEDDLNNSQARAQAIIDFWMELCELTGEPPELRL